MDLNELSVPSFREMIFGVERSELVSNGLLLAHGSSSLREWNNVPNLIVCLGYHGSISGSFDVVKRVIEACESSSTPRYSRSAWLLIVSIVCLKGANKELGQGSET